LHEAVFLCAGTENKRIGTKGKTSGGVGRLGELSWWRRRRVAQASGFFIGGGSEIGWWLNRPT